MDPLSDTLSLVGIRSARCTRFEAGGAWALRFPAKPAIKFVAVLEGGCWIAMPDAEPRRLRRGDTFLLTDAPAYVLATDLDLRPEDGVALFDGGRADRARHGGHDTVLIAGAFVFEDGAAQRLLGDLPPFLLIPAEHGAAPVLRSTLLILDGEIGTDRMGGALMTQRLAEILLVQALRAFAATHREAGWIGALADRRIGAAMRLMHGDVARAWTVDALARAVGMSRSSFAHRFRAVVGTTPLKYLGRWRMEFALQALRRGEVSVASLARRLGYRSESAFGNAFKRRFGRAPKRYWRDASDARTAGYSAASGSRERERHAEASA